MKFEAFYSSSSGNLYRLTDGGASLLIECGVPVPKILQAVGFDLSGVVGCLVSHEHKDHSLSAKAIARMGIPVVCSTDTSRKLGLGQAHRDWMLGFKAHDLEPFRIVPFETEHDCDGSLGFVVAGPTGKLLFATDTYFIRPRFRGLTHIAIECNWSKDTLAPDIEPAVRNRLMRSHMSLETCESFLLAQDLSTVREIWLLHLSDGNSDEGMFQRRIERATGKVVYAAPK